MEEIIILFNNLEAFFEFNNKPYIVFNKIVVNEISLISFSKKNNIFKIFGLLISFSLRLIELIGIVVFSPNNHNINLSNIF